MPLQEQDILQGRYRVVRSIKSGGMGAVYEAIDNKLAGTACAIKEVLPSALQGPDAQYVLQSFDSEVKALANLEHPNIPRVRDYFEQDGSRFIVLDLVKGKSLDEELREHLKITQRPMDPAVVALDMITVLETLHYLHTRRPRIVHRDVKPANLIRDETGRVKLVDFGIARALESQRPQTQVGTPGYCAPEQMSGKAEPRSDVYSVGATLYHLCSGHTPPAFCFDELDLNLPEHPGLGPIVAKATAMKPDQRYTSAEEMALALKSWLNGEAPTQARKFAQPPPAPTTTALQTLPPPQPAQDKMLYAVIAVLIAVLGGFFLWVARQNSAAGRGKSPISPEPSQSSSPSSIPGLASTPGPSLTPGRSSTPKSALATRPQPAKTKPEGSPTPTSGKFQAKPPKARPKPDIVIQKPRLDSSAYPTYQGGGQSPSHPAPTSVPDSPDPSNPVPAQRPPVRNDLSPPQGNVDPSGFRLQRPVPDGGAEYVLDQPNCQVKITTHHIPNSSNQEIRQSKRVYIEQHRNPQESLYRGGIRIQTDDPWQYQAFHIQNGVMFDIQIHPKPPNPQVYLEPIDQFIFTYPKRLRRLR